MRFSGRYVAENEGGDGICKLLIDKKHGMVIGVHLIGNYSSEIISSAVMMTELELRVREIKDMIFPHPTVSEILKEAIIQLL
jgi:dihydrolipoamide dehydrogenase